MGWNPVLSAPAKYKTVSGLRQRVESDWREKNTNRDVGLVPTLLLTAGLGQVTSLLWDCFSAAKRNS